MTRVLPFTTPSSQSTLVVSNVKKMPELWAFVEGIFNTVLSSLYGDQNGLLQKIKRRDDLDVHVLLDGDQPKGLIMTKKVISGWELKGADLKIKALWVDPEGQAPEMYGTALLEYAQAYAKTIQQPNCPPTHLSIGLSGCQTQSIEISKKKGFKITSEIPHYYAANNSKVILEVPSDALSLDKLEKAADENFECLRAIRSIKELRAFLKNLSPSSVISLKLPPQADDYWLAELARLSFLSTLDVSNCAMIKGSGFEAIVHLPITILNLSNLGSLLGSHLKHIAKLPLEFLDLSLDSTNKKDLICDDDIRHLSRLSLKSLNLSGRAMITHVGLAHLADMPLTSLSIERSGIVAQSGTLNKTNGLENLNHFPLTSLSVTFSQITFSSISNRNELFFPLSLTSLNVSGLGRTGLGGYLITPPTLASLSAPVEFYLALQQKTTSLRSLDVFFDNSKDFASLSRWPLTSLTLRGGSPVQPNTAIRRSDQDLAHLSNLPLTSLKLQNVPLTDNDLEHISRLPLKFLDIDIGKITAVGLERLLTLPLKHLRIQGRLSGEYLEVISKFSLISLEIVDSYGNIDDQSLSHLSNMPLETLVLGNCFNVTQEGIGSLPKTITSLTMGGGLDDIEDLRPLSRLPLKRLFYTSSITATDKVVEHISKMPISHLTLTNCEKLTDKSLEYIAKMSLMDLRLEKCAKITDGGIKKHLSHWPVILSEQLLSFGS